MTISCNLLFGQVNSMFPRQFAIHSNSVRKDFEFVSKMFIKTGKNAVNLEKKGRDI